MRTKYAAKRLAEEKRLYVGGMNYLSQPPKNPDEKRGFPTYIFAIAGIVVAFIILIAIPGSKPAVDETAIDSTPTVAPTPPKKNPSAPQLSQILRDLSFECRAENIKPDAQTKESAIHKMNWIYKRQVQLMGLMYDYMEQPDSQKKIQKVIQQYCKLQEKAFPIWRKAYLTGTKNALWENDVDVLGRGARHEEMVLTAGMFAANRNIKTVYEGMRSMVYDFRFKRVSFRWYEGGDETYYDLEPEKDGAALTSLGAALE